MESSPSMSDAATTTATISIAALNRAADELVRHYHTALALPPVVATSTPHSHIDNQNVTQSFRNCCVTLLKLIHNILKHSDVTHNADMYTKVRRIPLYNPTIQQHVVHFPPPPSSHTSHHINNNNNSTIPPGVAFLHACGLTPPSLHYQHQHTTIGNAHEVQHTLLLEPANESPTHLSKAVQLLTAICIYELQLPISELPTSGSMAPTTTTTTTTAPNHSSVPTPFTGGFNPYQGYRVDLTGQNSQNKNSNTSTGSTSKIDLELQQLQKAQLKLLQQQEKVIQHDWTMTIVSPSGSTNSTTTTKAVSNTTTPTMSDGTLLAQRVQQQAMERKQRENSGFTTRAMRDIEKLKQSKMYTHVSLSIHVTLQYDNQNMTNGVHNSNNTIIVQFHGKFLPGDTVDTVMTALRNDCLNDNDDKTHFELYSTPPMVTYHDTTRTLQQEQLVPASKLFLRWMAAPPPTTTSQRSKKTTAVTTKATATNPAATAILQPKWLSIMESNLNNHGNDDDTHPAPNTAMFAFPQSIPIRSALPSREEATTTPPAATATRKLIAPTKKLTKEELLLKRMMGGK